MHKNPNPLPINCIEMHIGYARATSSVTERIGSNRNVPFGLKIDQTSRKDWEAYFSS